MADGLQPRAQNIAGTLLGAISSPTAIPEMPVNITQLQTPVIDEARRLTQPMQSLGASSTGNFLNTDAINADVFSGAEQLARSTSPVFEMPQRPDLTEKKSGGLLSGLKNFVSDPAAMAQMAIAFNSMRLSPDQGLAQSMQNVIEREGVRKQTSSTANATADFLARNGRQDLADLVKQNPLLAKQALDLYKEQMSEGEQPSKVREYEFAKSQGYKGTYTDFLKEQSQPSVSLTTGPQVGTIPQGFQLVSGEDGTYRLEPIPGGPEDIAQQQLISKEEGRQELAETAGSVVFEDITRFKDLVRNQGLFTPVTGITGAIARRVPGTAATDAENLGLTIKANIGFDRLQQMREASPTGGALGNVSDREVATLQAVLGSLSTAQSDEQLLKNLDRLEEIYAEILYKLQAYPNASEYGFGASIQTQDDPLGIL